MKTILTATLLVPAFERRRPARRPLPEHPALLFAIAGLAEQRVTIGLA
jgi:hypothetical protein